MSWFGTQNGSSAPAVAAGASNGMAVLLAGAALTTRQRAPRPPIRGARRVPRGQGASRLGLLDRVREDRLGELPSAPAGRHTAGTRFVTDTARTAAARKPGGRAGVVIIASPSDLLAQLVAAGLMYSHVPTCQVDPGDLADIRLEWHGDSVTIDGQRVGGLLWRTLGSSLRRGDRAAMCGTPDPRIIASWLAAASFPSVRAVNAYDAAAWRRGAGWPVWKDRLGACGVPVEPPAGDHESAPRLRSLVVCGRVVSGPESPCVSAAAEALAASGVRLAAIASLPDGRVCDVDPQPQVSGKLEARRAAARITDYLAA